MCRPRTPRGNVTKSTTANNTPAIALYPPLKMARHLAARLFYCQSRQHTTPRHRLVIRCSRGALVGGIANTANLLKSSITLYRSCKEPLYIKGNNYKNSPRKKRGLSLFGAQSRRMSATEAANHHCVRRQHHQPPGSAWSTHSSRQSAALQPERQRQKL